MKIAKSIVVKNNSLADAADGTDMANFYRSELFINANRGILDFDVIRSFPRIILKDFGVTDDKIDVYAADKFQIPEADRNALTLFYQSALCAKNPYTGHNEYFSKTTNDYVNLVNESNSYYLTLCGMPVDESHWVYNTDERYPTNIPIHLMTISDRINMEKEGIFDKIIEEHPDEEYLKYCGKKNIDLYKARSADNFDLLYFEETDSESLNNDFRFTYNQCKMMTLNVYYSQAVKDTNQYYDSFLAMSVLFMTICALQERYLQADMTRDFYDVESFKIIYDSYGVPFYRDIPLNYHQRIIKNINKLIANKGSSQVFFDLFKLFDYADMTLNQYYLVKKHKMGDDGNPTFIIKKDQFGNEMYDENGDPILDSSNYEVNFSKAGIYEDPALAVSDSNNDIEYNMMVMTDPYWVRSDPLLQEKLLSTDYNYLETKYIGVQTVIDLIKVSFENAFVYRMLIDNKDITTNIILKGNDLGIDCSIFDLFIYLACLYCKRWGYQGQIKEVLGSESDPVDTLMATLGYDFKNAMNVLNEGLKNHPEIYSQIRSKIDSMDISTLDNVNLSYQNILDIKEFIINGYYNAKTKEEFQAYRDLYNTLLVSKEVREVYKNPSTGEIFETYEDILAQYNPELLNRFNLLDDNAVEEEMNIISTMLEGYIPTMKYLPFSIGLNSNQIIEMLFRILSFFKSAKAELIGYDVTYTIISRGLNFLKFLDIIHYCHTKGYLNEYHYFGDVVHTLKNAMKLKSEITYMKDHLDSAYEIARLSDQQQYLNDYLIGVKKYWDTVFDNYHFTDDINGASFSSRFKDAINLTDDDSPELFKLYSEVTITHVKDKTMVNASDNVKLVKEFTNIKDTSTVPTDKLYEVKSDGTKEVVI